MKLNLDSIESRHIWESAGFVLPSFDVRKMRQQTAENPKWVHFGPGNIFRAFIALRYQKLLDSGLEKCGITACGGYDMNVIKMGYKHFDDLGIAVILKADGSAQFNVVASVGESLAATYTTPLQYSRVKEIAKSDTLELISFTITEKGYSLENSKSRQDMDNGPDMTSTTMCTVTSMLLERYKNGAKPIALVSMDNMSGNGDKLKKSILEVASYWVNKGFAPAEFLTYLSDSNKVSFPWTMIDKITPRPGAEVAEMLRKKGYENAQVSETKSHSFISTFANAEECETLVMEDDFPNGRPAFEQCGFIMTDRETVEKSEKMKVSTCLNPLHTAMAITGCLLGYEKIADEMQDKDIVRLVKTIGYKEAMPVVSDPKVLNPMDFINDVLTKRLPNRFIPDTPWRIATDTSQKLGVRYGETVKSYIAKDMDLKSLKGIPLVYALWMRYLMGLDDNLESYVPSSDPLLDELLPYMKSVKIGDFDNVEEKIAPVMKMSKIFGFDLYESELKDRTVEYFKRLICGKGAVRAVLQHFEEGENA